MRAQDNIYDSSDTRELLNPTFTEASTRANINSKESHSTILGKIKKYFTEVENKFFKMIGKPTDKTDPSNPIPGIATLDEYGHVPTAQLPSYVDDVIEGYFDKASGKFYEDSAKTKEITPENGKIYIDIPNNVTYRWGGTTYAIVGTDLALGETSTTAYRGDRGKTAYDHSQSAHARTDATKVEASTTNGNVIINGTETNVYTHPAGTNPHGTTASDVGLGNVPNVTTNNQTPTFTAAASRTNIDSGETIATLFGKIKKYFADLKTVAFSGSYSDLSNKPGVVSKTANGLAPQLPNETTTTKYLRQDGKWVVPPDNNTTYSAGNNITLNGTTFSLTKANVTGALGYTPPTTNTTYSAGSNITLNGTTFSLTKANVTGALGYTPPTTDTTYSAGSNITLNGTTFSLTKANVTGALGYTPPTTDTTYSAGDGISLSGTKFSNSGVRSIGTGSANGTISVNTNGTSADVSVKGLKSAAFLNATQGTSSGATIVQRDNEGRAYAVSIGSEDKSTMVAFGVPNTKCTLTMQTDKNLVYAIGSTVIWSTGTSSRRYKHNIEDLTEERAKKILDIRTITFDYNDDQVSNTRLNDKVGVIAEEVEKILPDLIIHEPSEEDKNKLVPRSVAYEQFTPYLIKLCQMQQQEINNLTKRIEALETKE